MAQIALRLSRPKTIQLIEPRRGDIVFHYAILILFTVVGIPGSRGFSSQGGGSAGLVGAVGMGVAASAYPVASTRPAPLTPVPPYRTAYHPALGLPSRRIRRPQRYASSVSR